MEKSGRKLKLEVYKPEPKLEVSKEEAMPFLLRIGGYFLAAGGIVSFILSGAIMSVKSFFDVKHKLKRKMDKTVFRGRYVEVRAKKHL